MRYAFLAGVLALLFVAVLSNVLHNDRISVLRKAPDAVVSAALCKPSTGTIDTGVFGIHLWGPYATHPKTLHAIDELGVEWLYEAIHWPTVEAHKDELRVAEMYDPFFLEMAARDMNLVISLGNYWPTWISDSVELEQQLRDMVSVVVARYKPGGAFARQYGLGEYGVRYWEIINEPNYPCCGWGAHGAGQPVDAGLYATLLAAANGAIREQDPDAVVLFGGLSSGHTYYDPLRFVDEVYRYGAKDCFDVLAFHPYDHVHDFGGAVTQVRAVLSSHDDARKPIWFTELGEPSLSGANGKLSQKEVFDASVAQIDAVPAFFWFSMHDFSDTETWGILDGTLEPREPLYSAVREHLRAMSRVSE